MLLAIDVGNTNIVLGVFDGERLAESWRLATMRERTADEVGILVTHLFERSRIPLDRVDGIILSSVVPPLTRTMEEMARALLRPNAADCRSRQSTPGCRCCTRRASDVGADRVVNAVAAYEAYGRAGHTPVIVVDFGTATTFDAISASGRVHRRRDLSRDRHLGGRAVSACGAAAARRRAQAAGGDRPDDRHLDAVGAVLRLRRDGRRHRRAHARGAREGGERGVHRDRRHGVDHRGRECGDPAESIRTSRCKGSGWCGRAMPGAKS